MIGAGFGTVLVDWSTDTGPGLAADVVDKLDAAVTALVELRAAAAAYTTSARWHAVNPSEQPENPENRNTEAPLWTAMRIDGGLWPMGRSLADGLCVEAARRAVGAGKSAERLRPLAAVVDAQRLAEVGG